MRVSARIKDTRRARRLSYRKAAAQLMVDASTVLRWEKGSLPEEERLAELADWLEVKLVTLRKEWEIDTIDKALGLSVAAEAPHDYGSDLAEIRARQEILEAELRKLRDGPADTDPSVPAAPEQTPRRTAGEVRSSRSRAR